MRSIYLTGFLSLILWCFNSEALLANITLLSVPDLEAPVPIQPSPPIPIVEILDESSGEWQKIDYSLVSRRSCRPPTRIRVFTEENSIPIEYVLSCFSTYTLYWDSEAERWMMNRQSNRFLGNIPSFQFSVQFESQQGATSSRFTQQSRRGNPPAILAEVSSDGENWILFEIESNRAQPLSCLRYKKIRISTSGNNNPAEYEVRCQNRYVIYWNQVLMRWDIATISY